YVALALSHQRLAEASRGAAALRERVANLEMLDGLLDTLTGVLDVREVFDRVSAIAQKVIPHDATALTETIDDGRNIRVHANEAFAEQTLFTIPAGTVRLVSEPNEYKLVDDIRDQDEYRGAARALKAGMRALLVTSIFVEGRQFGALIFYSKTPAR